jgi:Ribbon-helix-helix protein, copG family
MAKTRWPKVRRAGKPVQAFVSEETLARLQQLAEQTGRPLAEEVRHAIERHLAQPPRLVTPELDEAAVVGGGAGRKRGRKGKE